jgi:hypothetical protein
MMTQNLEGFREGATAFRNLRDRAQKRRDELIDQANRAARHAPTDSLSTTFTDSGASLSVLHETEPDTSANELAAEETTIKRTRHMPPVMSTGRAGPAGPQGRAGRATFLGRPCVRTKLVVLKVYVRKTQFIVMNCNRTRALASWAR